MRLKFLHKIVVFLLLLTALFASKIDAKLPQIFFNNESKLLWVYLDFSYEKHFKPVQYSKEVNKRLNQAGWSKNKTDLKVKSSLIKTISEIVDSVRYYSRILGAISVEADFSQYTRLLEQNFVKSIQPVAIYKKSPLPIKPFKKKGLTKPDEYGPSYTQLAQIGLTDLHETGLTGQGVKIALLDAGFDTGHEAFQKIFNEDRLIAERDFVFGDDNVTNQNREDSLNYQDSHGTSVWSVIGAYTPYTMIGGAYGADFLLAKTERVNSETRVEEDNFIAGIEWADSLNADIISSSLGYRDFDEFEYTYEELDGQTARTTKAVNWASERGILVVTAAGNDRTDFDDGGLISPADSPEAISVGAVDSTGDIAYFSSHGPTADGRIKPDLCALGIQTFLASSWSSQSYGSNSGTSFSTPLIAAGCALILEEFPNWQPEMIKSQLKRFASRANQPDERYGWGIPDFFMTVYQNKYVPDLPKNISRNEIIPTPNPTDRRISIHYQEPHSILGSNSYLEIYDITGRKIYFRRINTLVPHWNLRNFSGQRVSSGIYLIRVKSEGVADKFGKISIIF